ncbi:hypothetical protein HF521_009100 [Silurus meridionalis]|uniref:Uncharacterized protein n=1 Tax=Silurus meridionalis TaxID=175797 RepID=A0A8T0BT82_SILME|nr:hypothetical protein HF521_009100 [Silurus meridionalis]
MQMEKTEHIMLTGRGSNLFVESISIPTVPAQALVTEDERKEWQHNKKYTVGVRELFNSQWNSACEAADSSLQYMAERVQGGEGAIVVFPTGDWSAIFTTERMAWAAFKGEGLYHGLNQKEMFEETLN